MTALRITLALAILIGALAINENLTGGPQISKAGAVIGRPLTPMSYAGVARRTTRRAAYAGAAAEDAYAYAVPPVYPAPPPVSARNCTQTTDAYGRVYTTC